jgi:hypothetical protein
MTASMNVMPSEAAVSASVSQATRRADLEDMEALTGSKRAPIILLAATIGLGLAGAAWAFWPSGGIGNPEDPAKILVVTEHASREPFLEKMGFDADAQTLDNLEAKAHAEVEGLEVEGLAAIVTLADQFGFGYVVFEQPEKLDFSGLELDAAPTFDDNVRYAVVSVGDLADPMKVTTGSDLLQALFEQDRLAALVPPNEPTDVEAVELRDKLREGVDAYVRGPELRLYAPPIR